MKDIKHARLNELSVFEEAFEVLKKENLKVMKENIDLRERDKHLSLIMSDLSIKVKEQELEIKSLVTAIKLLQDDSKKNHPDVQSAPTTQSNIRNVDTSNQFEVLSDIENDDAPSNEQQGKQGQTTNHSRILSNTSNEDEVVTMPPLNQPPERNKSSQHRGQTHHHTKQPGQSFHDGKRRNSNNPICGTELENPHHKVVKGSTQDSQINQSRVVILGDSMLKHLNTRRMQNGLSSQKVNIKTFPVAGVDQMKHYVIPTLNTKPDKIIMHIGTNDLHNTTPEKLLQSINDLGKIITQQNKGISIAWSEIITRKDDQNLADKMNDIETPTLRYNYVRF
ncbi:uncharacterized protein LOC114544845 [Dendronephthya gigantea]|uniref:uncharacterized protein LOC114544845 n=1 Tax=Dendronephthya gigantea TaxID=151771 RepID=UPI00106C34EC|nr:uncharacterized protein LOC114544845 [Dendronephthya gigantea]